MLFLLTLQYFCLPMPASIWARTGLCPKLISVIAKLLYIALQNVRKYVENLIHLAMSFQDYKEIYNKEVDLINLHSKASVLQSWR